MRAPSVLLVSILVILTSVVGSADNWRSLTPPPERETFRGACWNPSGFNLVGENGAILWSAEGDDWFPASSGLIRHLNAVATNGSIRVAVGEHGSWTKSSNGIAWVAGNQLTNREFNGVAYGESGFVAVGDGNSIFLSENASDWADNSTEFGVFRDYLDVAFGAGLYVAVGTDGAISVSSDGKSWQPYDVSANDLCAVAFSGSTWITMTRRGEVWKSSDSMAWSEVADLSWSYGDHDLIWDGTGSFVAVGASGVAGISSDGESWATHQSPIATALQCVAASPNRVAIGGSFGAVLSLAADRTWADHSLASGVNLRGVASSGSTQVAVGEHGTIIYSDGSGWSRASTATGESLNDASWEDGTFLVSGDEGIILQSGDGKLWYTEVSGTTKDLWAVSQDGPATVVVGSDDTVLVKDSDGWDLKYSDFFGGVLKGVAWTGSQYVAVGTETILVSLNGETWIPVAGSHPRLGDVIWTGSELIAVITGDPSYDGVYASPDGTTWTHRGSGFTEEFVAMTKAGATLVALGGSGGIFVSHDAVSWTKVRASSNAGQLGDITTSSGVTTVVGNRGNILSSEDQINWTGRDLPRVHLNGAFWTGEYLGVVGDAGLLATSIDGMEWTTHFTAVAEPLRAGVHGSSGSVVVGDQGTVLHATDRSSWALIDSGFSGALYDVAWNGSKYVAVGTGQSVLSSQNATNWVQRNSGFSYRLQSIAWEGTYWISCGDLGYVFASSDALSWTSDKLATSYNLTDLDVRDGRAVAVTTNGIWESINGEPWSYSSLGHATPYTAVASTSSDTVVTSGFGQVAVRPSGLTWQTSTVSLSREIADLEAVNSKLIGVSLSGRVLMMDRAEFSPFEPWAAAKGVGLGMRELSQNSVSALLPNLLSYTLNSDNPMAIPRMAMAPSGQQPALTFWRGPRVPGVSLSIQKLDSASTGAWTNVATHTDSGWVGAATIDEQIQPSGEVSVTARVASDGEPVGLFRLQSQVDLPGGFNPRPPHYRHTGP